MNAELENLRKFNLHLQEQLIEKIGTKKNIDLINNNCAGPSNAPQTEVQNQSQPQEGVNILRYSRSEFFFMIQYFQS